MKFVDLTPAVVSQHLSEVRRAENRIPAALSEAGEGLREAVVGRIQREGLNTAGVYMRTKSREPMGNYSTWHAMDRLLVGLQIDHVDLTFEGNMMRDFKARQPYGRRVEIGFSQDDEQYKADINERYFGEAFTPSYTEADEAFEHYLDGFGSFFI